MDEFKSESTQPVTVLLMEPDVILNFFICEFLETSGFKVFDVATTEEAMALLQENTDISAVIAKYVPTRQATDVSLVQMIAMQHPHMALVVIIDQAIIPPGLPPNARVLAKPFEPEMVKEILGYLLDTAFSRDGGSPLICQ